MTPFYSDGAVTIYHGDCREVLPALFGLLAPCSNAVVIADPPYGETTLAWDRWPDRWVESVGLSMDNTVSLWCFGSLRMFLDRQREFRGWSIAQDVIWEKHNGSSFHADRFRRVHEHVVQWYRGPWADVHKAPVTTPDATARTLRRKEKPTHMGAIAGSHYASEDGGPRLMRSVIKVRSEHGRAENETQKPVGIVAPLIEYACPLGGLVVSPFMGAGTDLVSAIRSGRRALGIELREEQCEIAAERCRQEVLAFAEVAQ